jgi:hypothetical protein
MRMNIDRDKENNAFREWTSNWVSEWKRERVKAKVGKWKMKVIQIFFLHGGHKKENLLQAKDYLVFEQHWARVV